MDELSPKQIEQARQLRAEGYLVRDVADELNVPASQVEPLFAQPVTPAGPFADDAPLPDDVPTFREQQAIENERVQLDAEAGRLADWQVQLAQQTTPFAVGSADHVRQTQALAEQLADLARRREALDQRQVAYHRKLQSLPDQVHYQRFRKRARQEKLVRLFNNLIQEVINNCDGIRWSADEVETFLEQAESLKGKVTAFCEVHGLDFDKLLIGQGLAFVLEDVESLRREQTRGWFSGTSVTFAFGPEHLARYKSLMLTDFEQTVPAPAQAPAPGDPTPPPTDPDDDLDD